MPNYKLQVFKPYEKGDNSGKYRLALIDSNKSSGYPSNFVCILPKRIFDKGKPQSMFARKFGDNSVKSAIALLEEAIKRESDKQTKAELQKRRITLTSNIGLKGSQESR